MIERTIFSDQHEQYRSTVRRFLEKEVAPHHEQWEEDGYVNRDVWLRAGENGLLCAEPMEHKRPSTINETSQKSASCGTTRRAIVSAVA